MFYRNNLKKIDQMERKQSFTSSFSHNFILKVTFILIVIKIDINFISLVLLSFGEGGEGDKQKCK